MENVEIERQLLQIVKNRAFMVSPAMVKLLKYVVAETLAGQASEIKAYTIAVEALGRSAKFDPQKNSSIRVLAGRVRKALNDYYAGDGKYDPVIIELPTGKYIPQFKVNEACPQVKTRTSAVEASDRYRLVVMPAELSRREGDIVKIADELGHALCGSLALFKEFELINYSFVKGRADNGGSVTSACSQLEAHFAIISRIDHVAGGLRIILSLVACETGSQIWSRTFNFEADDFPRALETVASEASGALGGLVGAISRVRPTPAIHSEWASLDAMAFYGKAYIQTLTPETIRDIIYQLEKALETNPLHSTLHAMLGECYLTSYIFGFSMDDSLPALGAEHMTRALMLDYTDQFARVMEGYLLLSGGDMARAMQAFEQAIDLNPNDAFLVATCGYGIAVLGNFEQGLQIVVQAMELNPNVPKYYHMPYVLYYIRCGQYEKAMQKTWEFEVPGFFWSPLLRTVVLVCMGRMEEARKSYAELLKLRPDFEERGAIYVGGFVIPEDLREIFFNALARVGFPVPAVES